MHTSETAEESPSDGRTGGRTRKLTFFDLPAELRNRIYDLIDPYTHRYYSMETCTAYRGPTQTNSQFRAEFLSWHHGTKGMLIDQERRLQRGLPQPATSAWLAAYGRSRVPLSRAFQLFCFLDPWVGVEVLLKGAVLCVSEFQHEYKLDQRIQVREWSLVGQGRLTERDIMLVGQKAEELLSEGEDGRVFFTFNAICELMNFLNMMDI